MLSYVWRLFLCINCVLSCYVAEHMGYCAMTVQKPSDIVNCDTDKFTPTESLQCTARQCRQTCIQLCNRYKFNQLVPSAPCVWTSAKHSTEVNLYKTAQVVPQPKKFSWLAKPQILVKASKQTNMAQYANIKKNCIKSWRHHVAGRWFWMPRIWLSLLSCWVHMLSSQPWAARKAWVKSWICLYHAMLQSGHRCMNIALPLVVHKFDEPQYAAGTLVHKW